MSRLPRAVPDSKAPPMVVPVSSPARITEIRSYTLITPLYGGGVKPNQADPVTVVRVPEVRGQLRFWWRACCGGAPHATPPPSDDARLAQMRNRERELWGMAVGATPTDKPVPSRVSIRLRLESGGQRIFWDDLPSALDYALFPLRGSQTWLLKDVRFSLELTYCQQDAAEVRAALWAWETFGGLGARTRRGFGALQCTAVNGTPVQPPATVEQAREAIHNGLLTHVADGLWHSHVPHLHRPTPGAAYAVANDRFRLVEKDSVAEAHAYLIRRLRSFRQSRPNQNSRSDWPEPDQVRRWSNTWARVHPPAHRVLKMPRARLGLPIIFHFKTDNDPPDHTLQGVNHDRLASPLILRPLVLANKAAAALAICLDAPIVPPGGLTLDPPAVVSPAPPLRADLTARDAQTTPLSVPLNKEPDILLAFLNRL